jgi:membrane fusion protein (multidrug efflux system)
MRSKKVLLISVALILVAAVAWRVYGNYAKTSTSSPKGKAATAIEVKNAAIGSIAATLSTTGTVQGIQEAVIAAKTTGRIQYLGVSDGSYVKTGQTLVELDAAEINAQVNQALANRNQALANRDNARVNLDRLSNLFQEDAVAKQQLDNAQTQYYVYDAQVAQTGATVDLYRAQLANTVLTAPFSGFVFNKRVVLGDMAAPNMPLMTIVDTSKVKIEISIGESDIGKVKIGQAVRFAVDAYPGEAFSGAVSEISPAADLKNRTFKIWVLCDNPDQKLKSGMFARVTIPYKENPQVVKVPKDALVIRDQKPYVFVVKENTVNLTPVVPGLESDSELEIVSGLTPNTPVSVWGHEALNDNDKVMIGKRGGEK